MTKFIIFVPMFCAVAIVLACCTSEPLTKTATTRQSTTTTTTTVDHALPSQPTGYRDNNMEMGPGMGR